MEKLAQLKALMRQKFKDGNSFWRGYAFHYANIQDLECSRYLYKSSEITTPIKKRSGFANVNENRLWNMQLAARHIHGLNLQLTPLSSLLTLNS